MSTTHEDINQGAPATSLDGLVGIVHANVPKTLDVSGNQAWPSNITKETRNGQDAFAFTWTYGSDAIVRHIYFEKPLIGTHDIAEICDPENVLWASMSEAEGSHAWLNSYWLSHLQTQFGFSGTGGPTTAGTYPGTGWWIDITYTPGAGPALDPGIETFSGRLSFPWTDGNGRLFVSPGGSVNATNITPSYGIVTAGGDGSPIAGVQSGIDGIKDLLVDPASGASVAESLAALIPALAAHASSMAAAAEAINATLGPVAELEEISDAVQGVDDTLSGSTDGQSGIIKIEPTPVSDPELLQKLDDLSQGLQVHKDEVKAAVDGVASKLEDPTENKNIAEKTGTGELSFDTTNVEAKIEQLHQDLVDPITSKGIAQVTREHTNADPNVAAQNAQNAAIAAELLQRMQEMSDNGAPLAAGMVGLSENLVAAAEAILARFPTLAVLLPEGVTGALVFPALVAAIVWAAVEAVEKLTSIVSNLDDVAGTQDVELAEQSRALLQAIADKLEEGLKTEDTAVLKQIRDALGWKGIPDENIFDESVRGFLQRMAENSDGFFLVDGETEEKVSIAQLLADAGVQVKWGDGDLLFQFP